MSSSLETLDEDEQLGGFGNLFLDISTSSDSSGDLSAQRDGLLATKSGGKGEGRFTADAVGDIGEISVPRRVDRRLISDPVVVHLFEVN